MRNRLLKLMLLIVAAAGGVVAWQRRNETPPTPPSRSIRPAEPFMDPVADRTDVALASDTGPLPQPPRGPFTTSPQGPADDLKVIAGIGPKTEQALNEQGITTFAQLAALDETDIDRLQQRLPHLPGRIRRDDWVGQAAALAQG